MASQHDTSSTPDVLYHSLLVVIDYHDDTSGLTKSTFPLGTHSSQSAAQAFASKALSQELNYQPTDFETYSELTPSTTIWPHADAVLVYAKQPNNGHEFLVKLDTTKNNLRLQAGPGGEVTLPQGAGQIYYVIQTRVEYLQDRVSGLSTTEIQNVYLHKEDASQAARGELAADRDQFAQYDEHQEGGQWPFGDDVVVHAVSLTGESYTVAVRTVAGTRRKYAKNTEGVGGKHSI